MYYVSQQKIYDPVFINNLLSITQIYTTNSMKQRKTQIKNWNGEQL